MIYISINLRDGVSVKTSRPRGWETSAMPSQNCWKWLVDPPIFLVRLIATALHSDINQTTGTGGYPSMWENRCMHATVCLLPAGQPNRADTWRNLVSSKANSRGTKTFLWRQRVKNRRSIEDLYRPGKLRWFGHLESKNVDDWVAVCRNVEVAGLKCRGRESRGECIYIYIRLLRKLIPDKTLELYNEKQK